MERVYNKLVRDNIPQIIRAKGEEPIVRELNDKDYLRELKKKLLEESGEVVEAEGDDMLEELADLMEVAKALAGTMGKSINDIMEIAECKARKRGAFDKKIFLEKVIEK